MVVPLERYGYDGGASSAREAALFKMNNTNKLHQEITGGKKTKKYRKKKSKRKHKSRKHKSRKHKSIKKQLRKRKSRNHKSRKHHLTKKNKIRKQLRKRNYLKRGGNKTVPQFDSGSTGPKGANYLSAQSNMALDQSQANAVGDCHATNSC